MEKRTYVVAGGHEPADYMEPTHESDLTHPSIRTNSSNVKQWSCLDLRTVL